MSAKEKSKFANYRDPLIWLACIIIGGILDMVLGEKVSVIKPIGQIFINLLFCLVVPLLFSLFPGSIASVGDAKRVGKLLGSSMGEKGIPIAEGLNSIAGIFYKMTSILMKAAPIGLLAYVMRRPP